MTIPSLNNSETDTTAINPVSGIQVGQINLTSGRSAGGLNARTRTTGELLFAYGPLAIAALGAYLIFGRKRR